MGHCPASNVFSRYFDNAIQNIPCKYNTLLYSTSVEDGFRHTYKLLDTCARSGITLKLEKFGFCYRQAEFVGFHLG